MGGWIRFGAKRGDGYKLSNWIQFIVLDLSGFERTT